MQIFYAKSYCFQVSSKRDALEEKSTGARNDYLLSLAAANAHQNRYFVVDLQSTMQVSHFYYDIHIYIHICICKLFLSFKINKKAFFLC